MTRTIGVLIGRFQIHTLTEGHKYLFAQVAGRCARVLALVGVPPVRGTRRDPLDYSLRARMLQDYWADAYRDGPELTVLPSIDCPTNEEWARRVDQMIEAVAPGQPATVYCGPDGCGPTYAKAGGRHPVEVLEAIPGHATAEREKIQPRHSEDFRAGAIYHATRAFLNPFPVVDVAILKGEQVLLAQKDTDGAKWRLIGGFVDVRDLTLEQAVHREVQEETGLEIGNLRYCGSEQIDDWRYRGMPERMLTAVFAADYVFGNPKANDDIARCEWVDRDQAANILHPNHSGLWLKVRKELGAEREAQTA